MYKWDAEEYRKSSANQEKWAKELMGLLKLEGHERVLDIGCGDGRITAEIASKLPEGHIVGIDNSPEMIKLARESFHESKNSNLKFQIMDARELTFNNEFDLVFSNAALHWVKDHAPVLKGIRNALKTKGRVIVQMAGKGNAGDIIDILQDIIILEKWKKYFGIMEFPYGFFDDNEYREMLESAGLKPVKVTLIPKTMEHQNIDELEGWIRTTWLPYTQKVPEELREDFIHEIAWRYMEKHPSGSNSSGSNMIELKMVRLEVEAERVD